MMGHLTSNTSHFLNDPYSRAFLSMTQEAIFIIDKSGHILLATEGAHQLFGYSDGEVLAGKLVTTLVPIKNWWEYAGSQNTLEPESVRVEGKKRDGSGFDVDLNFTQIEDDEVVWMIFVEAKHKKPDLLTDNNRMYFDIAEVILLALDQDGNVSDINKKGCEVLEYDLKELKGKSWFRFTGERFDEVKEVFAGVMNDDKKYKTHDNQILTKSGERKLIHWQNTSVKDKNGEVVGILSSGLDITEKQQILNSLQESERKLKEYSQDLEQQVEERTRELQSLLDQERNLSEMKSRFVSLAAHEFRTPLSTIISSASLISRYEDAASNNNRLKHVNRIKTTVNHMKGILEDFLSLDHINEGKVQCYAEHFEIRDVLEEVASYLNEILKPGQTISYVIDGVSQTMSTDRKLVRNILINLTSNAIKYSPEDKPIELRCTFGDTHILCEIEDKGIGIPEEEQNQLFERFFRAKNARNYQGTGLGLSIVKKYVELLNGEISYISQQGKGTTFSLSIPIHFS